MEEQAHKHAPGAPGAGLAKDGRLPDGDDHPEEIIEILRLSDKLVGDGGGGGGGGDARKGGR